ncbi:MAG: DUF4926 domain-containing protein [Nostoc sp.]|uniref:DUF4926 domain-containing protein n=1 Tax=Nostoc sp. TaxID=1180 RepID=UPI002FF5F5F6
MKLLDVVALTEDLPELGLHRGQVGTIVEEYESGVFEVEFSDLHVESIKPIPVHRPKQCFT